MYDFAAKFSDGLEYDAFLANHGADAHRRRWADFHGRVVLTPDQRKLLSGFERDMKVLCLAGAWCGDCVNQCPILDHFAKCSSRLAIRYFDRDTHPELAAELKVCGGARVPVVVFLSEDDFEVGRFGDRTLSKYRQIAKDQLGPACPSGIGAPPQSLTDAVVAEWLDIFERAQLILRTSARLREKHGD
jgi:thiol-disulfide isomerase/thioredoxin